MEHVRARFRELRSLFSQILVIGRVNVVQLPVLGICEDLPQVVVDSVGRVVVHTLRKGSAVIGFIAVDKLHAK